MIRVATFNVENLFDRPRILNLEDPKATSALLKKTDQLQKELSKTKYDKEKLRGLLEDLQTYVTVRVDSGTFFKGKSRTIVSAAGKEDWRGAVEFARDRFDDRQRLNTAGLIKQIDPDIMCMVEVEGREAMKDFASEFFTPAKRMGRNMLIDSPNDPRGIDIGLLWRQAVLGPIRSNCYDQRTVGGKLQGIWSRDCLEVALHLADGKVLHLLCNHFKSKMGGDPPDAQARRKGQATRVSEILDERYDLKKDLVIVLGDLNDTPTSAPLAPLLTKSNLTSVFDVAGTPADDRWTYYYGGAKKAERQTQIDYILVSDPVAEMVENVTVWRQGMSAVADGTIEGVEPLKGITSWKNAASDHAAISIDLGPLSLA